jgi:hypothetical protein
MFGKLAIDERPANCPAALLATVVGVALIAAISPHDARLYRSKLQKKRVPLAQVFSPGLDSAS